MRSKHIQPILTFAIAVFLLTLSSLGVQRGADPETRFRDAQRKQQVEGNPSAAIEIYREIAASANASAGLKAKALLGLATSLEALGQQAESVYERIIREFANQPEAAPARTRLAALKPPVSPEMTLTQIKFGPGIEDVVATDGQRVVYWDNNGITLLIGDKDGKAASKIFTATPDRRPRAEVSRDLSLVFLYFVSARKHSYAVIRTDGSGGYREVDLGDDDDLPMYGISWAFDNSYILLCKMGEGRIVHPLKLSLDDGKIVDLLKGRATSTFEAVASPDGRSIALRESKQSVSIMPAEGGEPETLAEDGMIADWTPDGHLVFAALEKDGAGFFAIPVQNGRAAGERTSIRAGGIGYARISKPKTSGNSLIFAQEAGLPNGPQIYYAALDETDHLSQWTALKAIGLFGNAYPTFSPDGTHLAYLTRSPPDRGTGVRIYSLTAGERDRELYFSQQELGNCLWAAQPSVLYCTQFQYAEGQTAILAIDVTTGRAETIASLPGVRVLDSLSPDERTINMFNLSGPTKFPQWEIGSNREIPGPLGNPGATSRDGRWIFTPARDASNRREVRIRPGSGGNGDWEHLIYRRKQEPDLTLPIPFKYAPDSNWLVYQELDSNGRDALFRVRTSGGEEQRLGDYPTTLPNSYLAISPDGRRFIVEVPPNTPTSASSKLNYWILQNFLPGSAATSKR